MSRFFVTPEAVGERDILINDRDDLKHMTKVLRLKAGDRVEVSDSVCWDSLCEIEEVSKDFAKLLILDKQSFSAEPETRVTLYQGIPKGSKMESIVQKTVELGVDTIKPVFMARTVVADKGTYGKKVDRLNRVAAEAVKQCKRGIIPEVTEPLTTERMIDELSDYDLVLFPYENEKGSTIKDVLREEQAGKADKTDTAKHVAIIIGPEGGFSDEEAAAIVNAGGKSVSLGKTTLRTETAGMAALAMVMYELELS